MPPTFQKQQVEFVITTLQNFAKGIAAGESAKDITKLVDSIFNTGFSEGFGAMLRTDAVTAINRVTKQTLTGAEPTKITFTDEFGRFTNSLICFRNFVHCIL